MDSSGRSGDTPDLTGGAGSFDAGEATASLTPDELTARIDALRDVEYLVADEASGAPEASWGDRFFFVGPDRMRPFATIVEHDTPGFDEDSRLDRPGVFRLNVDIGREQFERTFGYPPRALEDHRSAIDFSRSDALLPHPVYGRQGWACIVSPGPGRLADIDRLLASAHQRALRRHDGRTTSGGPPST